MKTFNLAFFLSRGLVDNERFKSRRIRLPGIDTRTGRLLNPSSLLSSLLRSVLSYPMATVPGHFLLSLPFPGAAPTPAGRPSTVFLRSPASLSDTVPLVWPAGTPRQVKCASSSGLCQVEFAVEENEPEEFVLRQFRREASSVLREYRRRRYRENTQEKIKRKNREASRRNSRRWFGPRRPFESTPTSTAAAAQNTADDGDNWDMPENDNDFLG